MNSFGKFLVGITVLVSAVSFKANAAFLPVCQRTPEVKQFIEQTLSKTCETIVESDLLTITRVAVEGRRVAVFKADDFTGFTNLEILNIRSNPYTELPEGLLKDLVHLKTLVIISTTLRHYPDDFLAYNLELENLHAFRNKVTSISESVFSHLEKLKNLKVIDFDKKLGEAEKARLGLMFPASSGVQLSYF